MVKIPFTWSNILETAASQIRNGWVLIPITVVLTIALLRIGLLASILIALALILVLWARRFRITVDRRNDD